MFTIHSDPLAHLGSQEAGGQNIYIRNVAEKLGKLGWEIDIFTRWDDPKKKQIVQLTKKVRVIRLKGGKTSYIPRSQLISILPEVYNSFRIFINFKNPYNLFHGHYWDGGLLATKAHSQFKKPLVENFHSLGIIKSQTKKKYLKNKNDYEYFVERLNIEAKIIKNSSIIISLAESEKQELNRFYGCPLEKVAVVPGGVDLEKWQPLDKAKSRETLKIAKDNFVLLYVGRLEWRKGIGTLISAANLLKKIVSNLKIIIVGGKIFGWQKNLEDFKEYKRLDEKAEKEKVKDMVKFAGRIPNTRLPVFYSAADALVIPSYYEPFGLVALEGMASKIPVIASRIGGLANTIKDNETGLLFEPHNPVNLKEKVLMLYQNKEFADKLVQNADEDIKKYSWETIAKKISDIYNSLYR